MTVPRTREAALIVALLLVGAALRAWEYFGGASLCINEIAVARNLVDRSALDLVSRPLDYDQSAPPAYLLATKLATALLGDGELALRLPRGAAEYGDRVKYDNLIPECPPRYPPRRPSARSPICSTESGIAARSSSSSGPANPSAA